MSFKTRWLMPLVALVLLAWVPAARVLAAAEGGAAADAHAALHGGGHGGEHDDLHEPLVPLPPTSLTINTSIWVIVIFVAMLCILYPTAWKNVLTGLKAREAGIRKDIADAEAARMKSEGSLKEYQAQLATAEQRVRDMLSAAATEAERIATNIRMQGQQEAEATKERAVKDIEAARRQAIQEIYAEAANLSVAVAERILRRNLNADDQRELVNESLAQMQAVGKN